MAYFMGKFRGVSPAYHKSTSIFIVALRLFEN